ncbi:MAG: nickel-dependent lactate racemase [candidate division Zixibacteria bacterium]|nr:nickel-dependent lactate racemase [candidate division Zixibacteria bacterium]
MKINLKYGDSYKELSLPDKNLLKVLELEKVPGLSDVNQATIQALQNPIKSKRLKELAKGKKTAVIVVSDFTRGVPYKRPTHNLLLPIVDELNSGGIKSENITFLVGTGAHRPHTDKENRDNFGDEIVDNFKLISHECDKDLISFGKLSTGNELLVNKLIKDSDLVVMTGLITTHYFGGYSGGRKGILPGVAGRESIRANHAMVCRPGVAIASLKDNPINLEMEEAAAKAGVDFLVNVVINDKKEIVNIVAGDLTDAFYAGVDACNKLYKVKINRLADAVIASAGGYPKDVNLYQTMKTMNNARQVVKESGTIVMLTESREGLGSDTFDKWLSIASSLDELLSTKEKDIVVGGHTAVINSKILKRNDVYVISSMKKDFLEQRFFKYAESLEDALDKIKSKHGDDFKTYIMPQGGLIYPCLEHTCKSGVQDSGLIY